MNISLSTQRAIVCGSTQGLGKAVALELAESGASITLIARNEESLRSVIAELRVAAGQFHDYLVADFSDPAGLSAKVNGFLRNRSPVHILVNNTGGPKGGPVIDSALEEFTNTFSQHLICNHILTQAVVPMMKAAKYGRIINIISISVKQPIPGLGVSNTIRGAVAAWAKTLAAELAPFGITVNNVLPGMTRTRRLDSLIKARAGQSGKSVEQIAAGMMAEIPAGRFGEPHELAAAVAFLASPAAAYINGVSLPVDGGRTSSL